MRRLALAALSGILVTFLLHEAAEALHTDGSFSSLSGSSSFVSVFQGRNAFVSGSFSSSQLLHTQGDSAAWNCARSTTFSVSLTQQQRQRGFLLMMGKGDGKKKRKKKAAIAPVSSSSSPSAAANPSQAQSNMPEVKMEPLRVTTDINIPIKRQIRYAQLNKQYAKQQANPGFRQKKVVRTKYRRTWDEEEIEEKKEERKLRGQDPNWDVILNQTTASPLVIVDGYNVIYQWSRLKKHMAKGDPQRARQLLVDDLENLRSLKGWRIEVVFDGTRKSNVGPLGHGVTGSRTTTTSLRMDQANNMDVSKHGVRVVYTGRGIEADSYIESRCGDAKQVTDGRLTGSFIVATDDAMIRIAGQSAGALCMSSQRFVDELKSVKKAVGYRVEAAMAKVNGQSVRPEKLRGTHFHNFGRGSVLIEDKRERKSKKKAQQEEEEKYEIDIDGIEVEEDENGIPWWAQVPNQTKPFP